MSVGQMVFRPKEEEQFFFFFLKKCEFLSFYSFIAFVKITFQLTSELKNLLCSNPFNALHYNSFYGRN